MRGREAAQMGVGAFHANVRYQRELRGLYATDPERLRRPLSVTHAALAAHAAVSALARPEDGRRRPGCTLVGFIVDPESSTVRFATVGDSRIYLANGRGDDFRQWGDDQGVGNLLTCALGLELDKEQVQSGFLERSDAGPGLHLALLVSDGVHGRVSREETGRLIREHARDREAQSNPKVLPRRIVAAVIGLLRKRGATDNASAVCVAWRWS